MRPGTVLPFVPLALAAGALAAPGTTSSVPVRVRFGNLAWVGARTALPRVLDGRTLVPPLEACDLLGLTCELDGDMLRTGDERLPVTAGNANARFVPLVPLARLAGQTVVWDQGARMAAVSGGNRSQGWRLAPDYLGLPRSVYLGPLRVSTGAPRPGVPAVPLTLRAERFLHELTLFSKTTQGSLRIVGSQTPSLPDNPNTFPGCPGPSCTLPAPRDALWTLAYLTQR